VGRGLFNTLKAKNWTAVAIIICYKHPKKDKLSKVEKIDRDILRNNQFNQTLKT